MFSNRPAKEGTVYTEDQLRNAFPQAAGITRDDRAKFQSSYDKGEMNAFVDAVDRQAQADGYNGTPTFLANDRKIDMPRKTNPTEDDIMKLVRGV